MQFATIGDLAAFAVREEAAISICDARRAAAVQVIDAHNRIAAEAPAHKSRSGPWWPFW